MTAALSWPALRPPRPPLRAPGATRRRPHPGRRRGDPRGGRHQHQSRHRAVLRAARGCGRARRAAARQPGGVLSALDGSDADDAFAAIRLAEPGGLGTSARHDVQRPAAVSLGAAMARQPRRDPIARQYVTGIQGRLRHRPAGAARRPQSRRRRHVAGGRSLPCLPRRLPRQPCGAQARAGDRASGARRKR